MDDHQVVIIGAGISGLYAACTLIDLGIKDIIILEDQWENLTFPLRE